MNHLKYYIRSLMKQKFITAVNIFGLTLGFTSCLTIFLYLKSELSFDDFHNNKERIYRLLSFDSNKSQYDAEVTYRLGPDCVDYISGIEASARLYNFWGNSTVFLNVKSFKEGSILYTDPSILKIFSFKFIAGDKNIALNNPGTVIITKSVSIKYFGEERAVGKTLLLDNSYNLTITGVIEDLPINSHIQFEFLIYDPSRINSFGDWINQTWTFSNIKTYVLLAKGYSQSQFYNDFENFVQKYVDNENKDFISKTKLQKLSDIHLFSTQISSDFNTKGNINTIIVFFSIAICILLIASINYISLSISNISKKINEIGVRKVNGAKSIQIIIQYSGESIILFLSAITFTIISVRILYPLLQNYIGLNFEIKELENLLFLASVVGLVIIISILSGIYISVAALKHSPINLMRGFKMSEPKNYSSSYIYLFIQFTLSILLIVSTGFLYKQLIFIQNSDLGYNKDLILVLPINQTNKTIIPLKESLLKYPQIKDVTISSSFPPNQFHNSNIRLLDDPDKKSIRAKNFFADYNFVDFLDITIKEGRKLSHDYATDENEGALVNETFVKEAGLISPLGKRIKNDWNRKELLIVGVVKDFYFRSFHNKIEPAIITVSLSNDLYSMGVKLSGGNISNDINLIKSEWKKINPEVPFEFHFLDETIKHHYSEDKKQARLILLFSLLAIFITCLGLIASSLFLTQHRTKEIGIRKVNGARVSEILTMLNKDFVKWVAIAFVIACPIAYYAIHKWLENFAYKTNLSWWIFALAGVLALGIALLTVSWQSWRAATRNPVETLRYE